MKTNKFFLALAAFAAVSMSSCSQEEELVAPDNQLSDNAVVFGTYIGASRASVMDLDALKKEGVGFGVMAYYTGQDVFGNPSEDAAPQIPNFMYNQHVTYNGSAWTYAPLKYWPNNANDKVSFFAYAPYATPTADTKEGITALSANNVTGDPTLNFVMAENVENQIDLLYADAVTDQTKSALTDGKVSLKFNHALSRISFSRQLLIDENETNLLDANTTVTINEVKFAAMSFGTSGTLNLANGTWSGVTGEGATYTLSGDKLTNVVLSGNDATKEDDLTSDKGYIMFIPMASSESTGDNTIYIKYTVKTKDDNLDGGYSEIVNEKTITVPDITFEKGKAYKFVLKIGLTSVKLDAVQVINWENGTITGWDNIVF